MNSEIREKERLGHVSVKVSLVSPRRSRDTLLFPVSSYSGAPVSKQAAKIPTLSPFARGYLSLCRFFTAAVWCVPALRVPLVHSLINHFRQNQVAAYHLCVTTPTAFFPRLGARHDVVLGPSCRRRTRLPRDHLCSLPCQGLTATPTAPTPQSVPSATVLTPVPPAPKRATAPGPWTPPPASLRKRDVPTSPAHSVCHRKSPLTSLGSSRRRRSTSPTSIRQIPANTPSPGSGSR